MAETPTLNALMVRHGLLVRAVAIAIGGLFLVILAIFPLIGGIRNGMSQLTAKEKQAAELTNKVSILSSLDPQVLANRVATLDSALPPRKDILLYLSAIDGLSRDLNLNFGGISLSPGSLTPTDSKGGAAPGLHTLDTTVKISGSSENIYSFLRAVEQTLPLMLIKDVKVDVLGADSLNLTLNLGMLWAPASVGSVSGPITLFTDKEQAYFSTLQGYHAYASLASSIPATGSATTGAPRDLFSP